MMDIVLLVLLAGFFIILTSKPVRKSIRFSASVTPLASIIGSGFLVSVPLIVSTIGIWAIAAILGLTLLAYLVGSAIRYNIQYGEPIFNQTNTHHSLSSLETLSHLVLTGAYFISVAYYLVLLSAFGLKFFGINDPQIGKVIATVLVSGICLAGLTKGLSGVEQAEKFTVSANLSAIFSLLVMLILFGVNLPEGYSWTSALTKEVNFDWDTVRFLMGLLIIIQGFETSRFMGKMYDANTRISAMKSAQKTSSVIYIAFFILLIPLYPYFTSSADVAGFIDVIGRVSPWLPYVVTLGAVASQFSASVADSIGASGLISDTSNNRLSPKHAYLLIGIIAVIVIWETDVVSIVSLASRAFALFYAIQCLIACLLAKKNRSNRHLALYGLLFIICLGITILGIPAG